MKNGLKGVTDAMVFCKSMKKGGPKPMIRDMKSFEVGGMTGTMGLQTANTTNTESSDSAKPPRWLSNIVTDVKRVVRKAKDNMQINSYLNKKNNNKPQKKHKSPGQRQQDAKNHKCTGVGCV